MKIFIWKLNNNGGGVWMNLIETDNKCGLKFRCCEVFDKHEGGGDK